MIETISRDRTEDAVGKTNEFIESMKGDGLDGGYTADQIEHRVLTTQERAEAILRPRRIKQMPGFSLALSKENPGDFAEAASVLPGFLVLVHSSMVGDKDSSFYPAVVSEDGLKAADQIRLHVMKTAFRGSLSNGVSTVLSAAGQSETAGVGDCASARKVGLEAEHFTTLLTAANDATIRDAWTSGHHVNHGWREQQNSSVLTQFNQRLFGAHVPQQTITITKQEVEHGNAALFWHTALIEDAGDSKERPKSATDANALEIVQGLGFEAVQHYNPSGIDTIKEFMQ